MIHLSRVDQFWYKYAYMEELLANYAGCACSTKSRVYNINSLGLLDCSTMVSYVIGEDHLRGEHT